jgi:imidazolonepropionase-like amidohydrolase
MQIVKQFAQMGAFPATWSEDALVDRNALLVVATEKEIDERWDLLRAAHPDFVKVFLEFSEEYEQRRNDSSSKYLRGIDPKLVPYIVRRAHRDGLRVSAHVYSATDFRNAVAAGVDLIAHMPGTGSGESKELQRFLITDEDARKAARQQVTVITTLGWIDDLREEDKERAAIVERDVIAPNVEKLRRNGVRIIVGSDQFRETPLAELDMLHRLGFSNQAVLRMAVVDTPRAIFPSRKIGALSDGFVANFLVLDANPLEELTNVRRIAMRIKEGMPIEVQH